MMEAKEHNTKTENPFLKYLGDDQEEFEKEWNKLTTEIGGDVLKFFQTNIEENFRLDELLGIQKLTVIIDNNFLFNYIRGLANNSDQSRIKSQLEDSFIYKFFVSEFTNVFAPPKIRKEIFEKVESKISSRNIDRANELAKVLLSKIEITEAFWVESWIKASKKLRDKDPDDIDYLALAYHINGHAIISDDKVFEETGSYETWSKLETKEILLRCNKGIVAFSIFGLTISTISVLIKHLLLFLKAVAELIIQMAQILLEFLANIFASITKIPSTLAIIAITGLFGWLTFTEKGQEFYHEEIPKTPEKLNKFVESVGKKFGELSTFFKELWEIFKPLGVTSLQIMGYLVMEFQIMETQFAELERGSDGWTS